MIIWKQEKAFIFCFEKQKKYKLARKEIMNIQNDDFMDIELDILNFRHQKLNLIKKIKKLNFIYLIKTNPLEC